MNLSPTTTQGISVEASKSTSSPLRKNLTAVFKISFVVLLLYFLAKKGFISLDATRQALQQKDRIIPAFLALAATNIFGILRWHWLLKPQNIHLKLRRTAELTMIGIFFNLALPGAVSGDFVKAYYIGKEFKSQRSRAFGSILFDRVAGVSALVLVSAGALLLGYKDYLYSPMFKAIQVLMITAATTVVVFYGYLFLVKEHHDPLLKIFQNLEKNFPKLGTLTRIYESLRHYHHHRITIIKVLLASACIHLIVGWCCYQFAQALYPTSSLPLLSVYVMAPLGLLVTAIPIGPAGIGTGNVAFLYFFGLLGYPRGADIYSLFALMSITIGSIGGIIYSRFKTREHLPELETISR